MTTGFNEIKAAVQQDTMAKLRRDVALISHERGPLRNSPFVRAHFLNRLACLQGNGTDTGWYAAVKRVQRV